MQSRFPRLLGYRYEAFHLFGDAAAFQLPAISLPDEERLGHSSIMLTYDLYGHLFQIAYSHDGSLMVRPSSPSVTPENGQ